jgi:hypothetical protein
MRIGRWLAVIAIGGTAARGGAQAPSTDVWVATLEETAARLTVRDARNITARPGYDNQPAWHPRGDALYFTRHLDGQTDIWRWDPATGRAVAVTDTPESEYSAAVTPDGMHLSVVRVERDSTQRLWRFPLDGGAPSLVLREVRPVGYHAWVDEATLALFVLGQPPTLQLADARLGTARAVARGIGRGVVRVPGEAAAYFVLKVAPTEWYVARVEATSGAVTRVARLPDGVEDLAVTPRGTLLCARGTALLRWDALAAAWAEVADLGGAGAGAITRLAVHPRGTALAFVAQERAP